jgi:membrane peptidoglycan carboxypeptidase
MPGSAPRRIGTAFSAFLGMIAVAVIAGVMVAVAVTPAIALTGTTAKNGIGLFEDLPTDLKIAPLNQKTKIYAKSGGKQVLLASFYTQDREVIPWKDVTATVKNATLAAEDVRFYTHGGVDPTGIIRATLADILGKNVQGASTITQQYVKNVCVQEAEQHRTQAAVDKAYNACVDPSVGRKLREARLAIALEKKYTKNEVLLGYLNIAPFGGRVYGIQSAAQYYYGVDAKRLTDAQAASLLAMVNNPNNLRIDEKANLAANTTRRDYILANELSHRLISDAQYQAAVKTPVKPRITQPQSGCQGAGVAGYFCDYVEHALLNDPAFGKTEGDRYANLQSAGWKVYTTLNLDLEKKAQSVMNTYVPKHSKVFNIGSSAISVEVGTGRIVTMVQNKNYDNTAGLDNTVVNYNADSAYGSSHGFQPGSTFKLFTLLQWLKTGHTLGQVVSGNARTIAPSTLTECGQPYGGEPWTFGNDAANEGGYSSVLKGTALSINGVFASMAQQVDLCDVRKLAESMGVHPATGGRLDMNAPFVIGGASAVAPLSMATAYAGIANNGTTCTPVAIDKVVKADGSTLPVPKSTCKQTVDPKIANAANYALHGTIAGGTAYGDQTDDGLYEYGKTGTTDNAYDTWMIGSTSKVTTAVWVGSWEGHQNLRKVFNFPYCGLQGGTTQAAVERHCVWRGIQTAVNKVYGGATSWPQPDPQYLYGGSAVPTTPSTVTGTVPNVQGMSKSAAEAALVSAGYAWAIGAPVPSSIPAGQIASTSPAIGSSAPQHSEVTIHPSSG